MAATWELCGPALLFCPATRPDRFEKALERADAVILDLEDAVPADEKDEAREAAVEALGRMDAARTIVRINALTTAAGRRDLEALDRAASRVVMVPKAEDPAELAALEGFAVLALCETATGVLRAPEIAASPSCVALMWGGEDLTASLGGRGSRKADGAYHDVVRAARTQVLLAAGACGKHAIDGVYLDIADVAGLAVEAGDAAKSGFAAKACIHPNHVGTIRRAFAPDPEDLAWAQGVLAAAGRAGVGGVFTYEGRMVDGPLLIQAEAIVHAAARVAAA